MSFQGKCLISHPNVPQNSVFHKSVIYIHQDDPNIGTLGLILNKMSGFTVSDVCAEKGITFGDINQKVFHGGPINEQALQLLHTNDFMSSNTQSAGKNLLVSSDNFMLQKLGAGNQPAWWRLFGGMAGWAPGQLNAELKGEWPYRPENSWLIADLNEDQIFGIAGEKQWLVAFEVCSKQTINSWF